MQQELIQKTLQKIVNQSIKENLYKNIIQCEIYFVFNSKNPKGDCSLLYGIRLSFRNESRPTFVVENLKLQIKKYAEKVINYSICCNSVVINKV